MQYILTLKISREMLVFIKFQTLLIFRLNLHTSAKLNWWRVLVKTEKCHQNLSKTVWERGKTNLVKIGPNFRKFISLRRLTVYFKVVQEYSTFTDLRIFISPPSNYLISSIRYMYWNKYIHFKNRVLKCKTKKAPKANL